MKKPVFRQAPEEPPAACEPHNQPGQVALTEPLDFLLMPVSINKVLLRNDWMWKS